MARTAHGGRYTRHADGWVRTDTGQPVPGAEDMTLANLYGDLTILGDIILIPEHLARNEPDLAWVLDIEVPAEWPGRLTRMRARDPGLPVDAIPVPIALWNRRVREAGVIGLWAPELHHEIGPPLLEAEAATRDVEEAEARLRDATARRDDAIRTARRAGATHQQIADMTGLSRQRVAQILDRAG